MSEVWTIWPRVALSLASHSSSTKLSASSCSSADRAAELMICRVCPYGESSRTTTAVACVVPIMFSRNVISKALSSPARGAPTSCITHASTPPSLPGGAKAGSCAQKNPVGIACELEIAIVRFNLSAHLQENVFRLRRIPRNINNLSQGKKDSYPSGLWPSPPDVAIDTRSTDCA